VTTFTRAQLAAAVDEAHGALHAAEDVLAPGQLGDNGSPAYPDVRRAHEALHRVGAAGGERGDEMTEGETHNDVTEARLARIEEAFAALYALRDRCISMLVRNGDRSIWDLYGRLNEALRAIEAEAKAQPVSAPKEAT
jgi:hypothetical protein